MKTQMKTDENSDEGGAMKGGAERGREGHGLDATLAALATLTAAWPISTLLADPTWLRGTALLLAVIAVSGVAARSLALRGWQVLMVQLACALLAASEIYGRGHLWHGLPTFETLGFAGRLVRESMATAQRYAAPAPTTPGLIFVVGCSLALIALAVDYLAVTRRSPSLAGLPLLTVFLAAVANQGTTLPAIFFLAAAATWLILVARAGSTNLRRWGTTVAVAHTPVRHSPESQGVYEHASLARMLGSVALVAAVAVPVVLPQPPPTFLASGLGRSSSVTGNKSQTVGFSQSLNLAADLKNPSRTPVLQYTTTDPSPPPLGVSVGSYYRSEPGMWLPWGRPWNPNGVRDLLGLDSKPEGAGLSTRPTVPPPTGLSPVVPRKAFVTNVRHNLLELPNLAVPYPMVGADLAGIAWGADYQTQRVMVAERPDAYRVSYWHLQTTAALLQNAAPLSERDRKLFAIDLALDGPYLKKVTALTKRLTSGKTSSYEKAMAIQQYLRADGGFTYSLTLSPAVKNRSGLSAGLDSLTNFLVTKRGYCVQFATAMVMMSRAAGIPARLAIGFLPGTEVKGVWTVVAADAHTWPQLYLDGVGWTRFEPTPSRGATPEYAVPTASAPTGADGRPLVSATAPATGAGGTARKPPGDLTGETGTGAKIAPSSTSALRWLSHGWGVVLLGSLAGLLGTLLVPTAGAWRRRRSLKTALSDAQRIEVQWQLLTSSLGDLGIAPAPSHTPRQLRAYYDREAFLDAAASQALGRVVQTLERSRYAASPPESDRISEDVRLVFRAAAESRAGRDRLRAALWPSTGVVQLRSARATSGRCIRLVEDTLRQWCRRLRPRTRPQPPAKGLSSRD